MDKVKKYRVLSALIVIAILLLCVFEQIVKKRKSANRVTTIELPDNYLSSVDGENYLNKLSLADIRNMPGYEFISDEEGYEIIEGLYQLSLITLIVYENESK